MPALVYPRLALSAALLVFCLFASPALAGVKVHDGDTITLNGARIRISAIDAPELHQQCRSPNGRCLPCGVAARDHLARLIGGRTPKCSAVNVDRYDRTVATCSVGGRDLGEAMLRGGHAVTYPRYLKGSQRTLYPAAERDARHARRGVHAGRFDRPDRWRKGHRMRCD